MPNKSSFLALKKNTFQNNSKVGYLKGGIVEENINMIKEKFPYKFIPYDDYMDKINDLKNGTIEQAITDYVDIWSHGFVFIEDIKHLKKDRFAVLLAKNCSLLKDFKKTFKYFFSSPPYYSLIKKHFGDEALNYFKINRD
jgi:ABC-type amino acid transport substrate-binding protein